MAKYTAPPNVNDKQKRGRPIGNVRKMAKY